MSRLHEMLRRHEGLKLHPYKCPAGRTTIGYGHNLEARGEPIPDVITIEQAERWLDEDIASARAQCETHIKGWEELGEVRRAVLVDMCFNLGIGGLLKFKKMLAYVEAGKYSLAAIEMKDSLWAKQVGKRAITLSTMMMTGAWE